MWPARDLHDLCAERPRIVITGPSLHALSGIATHVNLLLGSSVCRRFTLVHLCAGGEGLTEGFARRILRHVRTPVRLFVMLMAWHPAILHINTSLNARSLPRDASLLLIAWLARCPVVWQVHGGRSITELERNQPIALPMLRLLLRVPRRVVVISGQDQSGYAKVVAPDRLRRILNAVQVPALPPRAAIAPAGAGLRLTYMGRLVAGKGVLDLIEAMQIIAREQGARPISLRIAGAGPLETQLRMRVQEYGLAERVELLGPIAGARKNRLLEQTDVFVMPTFLPERLPYALLESMAEGIPAVASAIGGVAELIEHRRTGLLVPPRRPDLLADAILQLASDRQLLEKISRAARQRIRDSHDLAGMAARFCALYDEILDEPRHSDSRRTSGATR
jgi:glycosyltransferase involved in cell wall biosynthesis